MPPEQPVPMVRCHLDGDDPTLEVRYVPAAEFDLWSYLMQTKHERSVTVDEVSIWVPETTDAWAEEIDADALHAVLRIRFEKPGPHGAVIPAVRFFAAETYETAGAALLAHFDPRCRWSVEATPGYFVAAPSRSLAVIHGRADSHRRVAG
jgi:hypothetical protein